MQRFSGQLTRSGAENATRTEETSDQQTEKVGVVGRSEAACCQNQFCGDAVSSPQASSAEVGTRRLTSSCRLSRRPEAQPSAAGSDKPVQKRSRTEEQKAVRSVRQREQTPNRC